MSSPTAPSPTISSARLNLVKRADHVCGSLASPYPGVAAPSCTGTYSECAFVDLMAGCCDSSGGACRFYTSCFDHDEAATMTSACSDALCLNCPSSAPFCTEYRLIDENLLGNWLGYSCGQTPTMVFAIAMSTLNEIPLTSTERTTDSVTVTVTVSPSSSSSVSSSTSSTSTSTSTSTPSTTTTTNTNTNTNTSTRTSTTSSSTPPAPPATTSSGSPAGADPVTTPAIPSTTDNGGSNTNAALIGGVVAGVAAAVIIAALVFFAWRVKKKRAERVRRGDMRELSQPEQGFRVLRAADGRGGWAGVSAEEDGQSRVD